MRKQDSPLRGKVREQAENRPGIYRFLGPRAEVLYVGKSVRVRTRLLSYFRDGAPSKVRELLRVSETIEWEYVPNEFEALLREFRQIRAFGPRFNVRHRRDRPFAWVKVTREAAPRLVATRRPRPDGARYFGPFPAGRSLPRTLGDLARILGIRDCPARTPIHFADQLDFLGSGRSPLCPRAEMGSCPGPCAGLCSRNQYREGVRKAVAFLEGRNDEPIRALEARMEASTQRMEFEHAGRIRDRIQALERLRSDIAAFRRYLAGLTFVYRVPADEDGRQGQGKGNPDGNGTRPETNAPGDRGYLIQEGRVRLTFPWPGGAQAEEAVRRIASDPPTPPEAMSPGGREELFLVTRWFRDRPEEMARTMELDAFLDGMDPDRGGLPGGATPSPARAS